jgi:hypothetical protein
MRAFYLAYPKIDALRRELTWTHYRLLLRLEKPHAAFWAWAAVTLQPSTGTFLKIKFDSKRSTSSFRGSAVLWLHQPL